MRSGGGQATRGSGESLPSNLVNLRARRGERKLARGAAGTRDILAGIRSPDSERGLEKLVGVRLYRRDDNGGPWLSDGKMASHDSDVTGGGSTPGGREEPRGG